MVRTTHPVAEDLPLLRPTPCHQPHEPQQLVTGDAVEAVRAMKAESQIELRTLGSVSLCRSLITAELVDRFQVVVFPVVTGATGQDRIYDGYPDLRLDLVESRTFEGGLQLLEYVPTVLDGPPGTTGATS